MPGVEVPTVPEITTRLLMSPSTLSTAVAPSSLYGVPTESVTVDEPLSPITGAVVSTAFTSTMRTTGVALFPALSFT